MLNIPFLQPYAFNVKVVTTAEQICEGSFASLKLLKVQSH